MKWGDILEIIITFIVHDLLAQCITGHFEHLLYSPKQYHIIAVQLCRNVMIAQHERNWTKTTQDLYIYNKIYNIMPKIYKAYLSNTQFNMVNLPKSLFPIKYASFIECFPSSK